MIIQISSGQGPQECQLAVKKLADALQKEFKDMKILDSYKGTGKDCYHSIRLTTESDVSGLEGSILWICQSPFRPHHKRKNWFVDVSILPDRVEISKEKNYRIETFHCGGKGGQNVNKVETGVRVTHIPTGIVATCTEERSQYQNRQKAIARIQLQLQEQEAKAREKQVNDAWKEHNRIIRGNPVRTYLGMDFKLHTSR